jgi:hypothetical protein
MLTNKADLDEIDIERLENLATALGLWDAVWDWIGGVRVREANDDGLGYPP